ncbi:MFS transporter [Kushneria indalinina]|uniref:MFS transporter n=1 Tax=Kushneria indalinina DSM 14324 TaxID=1122140 RepID=A0A3D9DVC9_9GAMM|nr:MFS transporter [Kushneria indalinina]REC94740.1 hypothetical protein C8D72_1566 [Kushneria indalinina DSM 14324]
MLMLSGLMLSYAGSSVVEGSVPTLVAVGMLSPVWIALYTTFSRAINASAYVMARLLGHYSPYRVLLICEVYDMIITLVALLLLYDGSLSTPVVLITYVILTSVIPVITSIANGTYAGALSLESDRTAVSFNAFSLSLLTLATLVIGRPLGSLLIDYSLYAVLVINLIMTLASFLFRWAAMKRDTLFLSNQNRYDPGSNHASRLDLIEGIRYFRGRIFCLSASAPVTTPLIYLSMGLFLYYMPPWLAAEADNKGEIVAMVGILGGLGSMIGPLLFYALKHRFRYRHHVTLAMFVVTVDELMMLGMVRMYGNDVSMPMLSVYMMLNFCLYLAAAYCNVANLCARQKRFAGKRYPDMVGITFSLASLFMLAGTWSGYLLDASSNPTWALLLGTMITLLTTMGLLRTKASSRPGVSPNR